MRYLCLVLVLLGMPLPAFAQHASSERQPRSGPGQIGLPLPPIGLPPLNQNLPPWKWDRVQTPSWERPQTPAWERQGPPPWERGPLARLIPPVQYQYWQTPSVVYVMQPYPYLFTPPPPVMATQPAAPIYSVPAPQPETGRLRLDVEPAALLQIFVDGVYVGTPADLGGELDLRPGSRRIEIRAAGHQPLIFDARVEADRTITYRGELTAIAGRTPAPPRSAVPAGGKTLYVIPGCYLGNVPPEEIRLPAGCDISRMKTHTP